MQPENFSRRKCEEALRCYSGALKKWDKQELAYNAKMQVMENEYPITKEGLPLSPFLSTTYLLHLIK